MNTQLLDTLKEKWTKKSTKIACASVGTVAVLGVVGALIACNLPHTEQVVAEDGTVTTVQTQQKESHGLFDIFHAPTEPADAAQNTKTEITPPQTNADGTPQAAASGDTTSNPAVTPVQTQTSSDTSAPASVVAPQASEDAPASAPAAAEPSPAAAEPSAAPAPAAPQEMPRTNVHGGVYMPNINCYKVIDVQPVDGVDPKMHHITKWWVAGVPGLFDDEDRAIAAAKKHPETGMSMGTKDVIIYDDKGVLPKPGKYHLETLDGRRISPYITIAPGGSYHQS